MTHARRQESLGSGLQRVDGDPIFLGRSLRFVVAVVEDETGEILHDANIHLSRAISVSEAIKAIGVGDHRGADKMMVV